MALTEDVANVLVVADHDPVGRLQRWILESAGHHVIDAGDAYEAVAILAGARRIDVVVADMEMSGPNAARMAAMFRHERPDQKILYVTRHVQRLVMTHPLREGEAYLQKPFPFTALCDAVARLLNGKSVRSALRPAFPRMGPDRIAARSYAGFGGASMRS